MTSAYQIATDAHCRRLDDEVAVYLADRCETHLLDDTAWQLVQVLEALTRERLPATTEALARRLLDQPDTGMPPDGGAGSASVQHADACLSLAPVLAALANIGVLTVTAC